MRSLLKTVTIVTSVMVLMFAGVAMAQTEPEGEPFNAWDEALEEACESFGGVWREDSPEIDRCEGVDLFKEICESTGATWNEGLCGDEGTPAAPAATAPAAPTPAAPAVPTGVDPTFTG